jgi:hypothetical protein
MPITFGIYDFFSYTVPGVLYILTVNELLKVFDLPPLTLTPIDASFGEAVVWVILAYVVGHLMDTFAIAWYSLFNRFDAEIKAMRDFKHKNNDLEIDFNLDDRKILLNVVRHNKPDVAQSIDSYKAISIMLNNISLALCLLGIVELMRFTVQSYPLGLLAGSLTAFFFSVVAVKRSRLFNEWHWSAVFGHARHFGRSVAEMYGIQKKTGQPGKELPRPILKKEQPKEPVDLNKEKAKLN